MPPRWVQHPVTVFLVPLITLLCAPYLYRFLPASINPSYDDAKLQRIANLMDEIYTTLADSTFIPHNAVQRGPHILNATAPVLKCKPTASVLRLMELLPYVDRTLVLEPDWLYGGHFMDYRDPEHLAELCDPLRGESIGWNDYMEPSDIALTNWGTGGWNNDRTWVLIYNTERDAIRIFEAELWVERRQAEDEFGEEMNKWWFEDDGEGIWDKTDGASHVLRAIANNYKTLRRTPWETSNRDGTQTPADIPLATRLDPYGLDDDYLRRAMKAYGWPQTFNPVKFNAEFLRVQHLPRVRNMTEAVQGHVDAIKRAMAHMEDKIVQHRTQLEEAKTEDDRWMWRWHIHELERDLEDKAIDLSEVEQDKADMCPNGPCNPNPTPDLWQQWAISHKLREAERLNLTEICERRIEGFEDPNRNIIRNISYRTQSRVEACKANEETKLTYVRRAHEQSTAEALYICEEIGCKLLNEEDVWARARLMTNSRRERGNAIDRARLPKSLSFKSQAPPEAKFALGEVNKFIAHLEYGVKGRRDRVDHVEGLIDQAKQGQSELLDQLVHLFQITTPEEVYDDVWIKTGWKEYNKWMWLHQVQKQAESGSSAQALDPEPETIDATTQTEIDRIRAQHKPSAERLLKAMATHIHNLRGFPNLGSYSDHLLLKEQTLLQHRYALETTTNEDEKALHAYRMQRTTWDIEDSQADLEHASKELASSCPDEKCVSPDALILWELNVLQHTLEETHHTDLTETCEQRFSSEPRDQFQRAKINTCIADKVAERYYLELATAQCKAAAVAQCEQTGCELLPFDDVFERAQKNIEEMQRTIAANDRRMVKMQELRDAHEKLKYVDESSVAAMEFNMHDDLLAQGNYNLKEEISELKKRMEELRDGRMDEKTKRWLFWYLRGQEEEDDDE